MASAAPSWYNIKFYRLPEWNERKQTTHTHTAHTCTYDGACAWKSLRRYVCVKMKSLNCCFCFHSFYDFVVVNPKWRYNDERERERMKESIGAHRLASHARDRVCRGDGNVQKPEGTCLTAFIVFDFHSFSRCDAMRFVFGWECDSLDASVHFLFVFSAIDKFFHPRPIGGSLLIRFTLPSVQLFTFYVLSSFLFNFFFLFLLFLVSSSPFWFIRAVELLSLRCCNFLFVSPL